MNIIHPRKKHHLGICMQDLKVEKNEECLDRKNKPER